MNNKMITTGNLAMNLTGNESWNSPACQPAIQTLNTFIKLISQEIPTDRKYTIGIEEAARYSGIGTKKLRQIVADNPQGNFYLEIGTHILLKRKQFEAYLDTATAL